MTTHKIKSLRRLKLGQHATLRGRVQGLDVHREDEASPGVLVVTLADPELRPDDSTDQPPFRYVCPECQGAGEVTVDVDPQDPASGHEVKCYLCDGDAEVTLAEIERHDQENADRAYERGVVHVPPTRTLVPVEPPTIPERLDQMDGQEWDPFAAADEEVRP